MLAPRLLFLLALSVVLVNAQFVFSPGPFPFSGYNGYYSLPEQASWGDFNNDGFLDLALSTAASSGPSSYFRATRLYRNNNGQGFVQVNGTGLEQLSGSTAQWGDYNNDGVLDLLIGGDWGAQLPCNSTNTLPALLYKGDGNGTFTQAFSFGKWCGLAGVWADLNNDGWQDIILVGSTAKVNGAIPSQTSAVVWSNNKDGTFTSFPLPSAAALGNADVCVGDYDNDGFLDLGVIGENTTGFAHTVLLHNNFRVAGNNTAPSFTVVTTTSFENHGVGSCAWGDYNADGWLDFLLTGYQDAYSSYTESTFLWENLQGTGFKQLNTSANGLVPMGYSTGHWGDYNNDGLPDICLMGRCNSLCPIGGGTQLYILQNQGGNSNFYLNSTLVGTGATGDDGTCQWGDYNNDGRLDIFAINIDFNTALLTNHAPMKGVPPPPVTALNASFTGSTLNITWQRPTGVTGALSYNVGVWGLFNSSLSFVLSPLANPLNGFRLVPAMGNAQTRLFMYLEELDQSVTYYVSVQTVDAAFRGSLFQNITIIPPQPTTSSARRLSAFFSPLLALLF